MKHLKKFESLDTDKLKPNPKWDEYVLGLFNQYIKLYDEECYLDEDEVIDFFNSLQDEIDDSVEIEVWAVDRYFGQKNNRTHHFLGLAKAYGSQHACIKLALEFEHPDIIDNDSEAWMPEEQDIEIHINRAKEELEKWTKVY
jgi:hypothetical protein